MSDVWMGDIYHAKILFVIGDLHYVSTGDIYHAKILFGIGDLYQVSTRIIIMRKFCS